MVPLTEQQRICSLLERLCAAVESHSEQEGRLVEAIESLHRDLRPELRRTETLRRTKEERQCLQQSVAQAVAARRYHSKRDYGTD